MKKSNDIKFRSRDTDFNGTIFSDGQQNKLFRPIEDDKDENSADKTLKKLKSGNGVKRVSNLRRKSK